MSCCTTTAAAALHHHHPLLTARPTTTPSSVTLPKATPAGLTAELLLLPFAALPLPAAAAALPPCRPPRPPPAEAPHTGKAGLPCLSAPGYQMRLAAADGLLVGVAACPPSPVVAHPSVANTDSSRTSTRRLSRSRRRPMFIFGAGGIQQVRSFSIVSHACAPPCQKARNHPHTALRLRRGRPTFQLG